MKYNRKDLMNSITSQTIFDTVFELDGHKMSINNALTSTTKSCLYSVHVDGKTLATRAKYETAIQKLMAYINAE